MSLSLGPMPAHVRFVVHQLVTAAEQRRRDINEPANAFLITSGPSYSSYLNADGEAWDLDLGDGTIHPVPDGPRKVGLIVLAAQRCPELAQWLPRRPESAKDCHLCQKLGWLPPPFPRTLCPECFGMGWRQTPEP